MRKRILKWLFDADIKQYNEVMDANRRLIEMNEQIMEQLKIAQEYNAILEKQNRETLGVIQKMIDGIAKKEG